MFYILLINYITNYKKPGQQPRSILDYLTHSGGRPTKNKQATLAVKQKQVWLCEQSSRQGQPHSPTSGKFSENQTTFPIKENTNNEHEYTD
jgi:hypothetical protein